MAAKNRTKQILGDPAQKELLSSQNEDEAYRLVTSAAVFMASCGFVKQANTLLSALWSQQRPHSGNVWLKDRAMMVLWHHSANLPPEVPFAIDSIESIELAHRACMSGNRWSPEFLENERANNPGQLATKQLARAMIEIYPTQSGLMPAPQVEIQGIADFETFRQTGFCHGFDAFSALTNLAELCAKHGRIADAKRYILEWHDEFVRSWYNFIFECLAANRYASKLLLDGLLAEVCELDSERSERYLQEWLIIVDRRFGSGPELVYEKLEWPRLLQRISQKAMQRTDVDFSAIENKGLCHAPASQEEINAVEAKLGTRLPDDYKQFLQSSNGLEAFDSVSVRMSPASDLDWLRNVYPDVVEIWTASDLEGTYAGLERSLLIGDLDGEQQLLLVPSRSVADVGDCQWECWFFASWVPGEIRYSSFRAYVEHVLIDLENGNSSDD